MGKMRGVAATLVSVVVFVSLLISNLTLLYAENQRLWMASVAKLESDEGEVGSLLVAQGTYSGLGHAQAVLVRTPPPCSSWNDYEQSLASSTTSSGVNGAIRYNLTVETAVVSAGPESDNMTLLRPFAGYLPGALNMGVRVRLDESSGGLPSYARDEYHFVHLPISLSRMLSLCLALLQGLRNAYRGGVYCNRVPTEAPVNLLSEKYSELASFYGLSLSVSHWFVRLDGCWFLSYAVTLSEGSVEGVSGSFEWHLSDSGVA